MQETLWCVGENASESSGEKRKNGKIQIHFCHGVGASNIKSQCGTESNILYAYTHRPWFPLWEIWLFFMKTLVVRQWSHSFCVIKIMYFFPYFFLFCVPMQIPVMIHFHYYKTVGWLFLLSKPKQILAT